jgi:hypothetical protein
VGELCGVVTASALVRDAAGDRRDADDRRGIRLSQDREQSRDHPLGSQHVDVEHAGPVVGVAGFDGVHPERAAGVADEGVRSPGCRHGVAQCVDILLHGQVGDNHLCPGFSGERLQPVRAAGDADHVPASRPEQPHGGGTDP